MSLLVLALALLLGSAVAAMLLARAERGAGVVGAAGCVAGCIVGLVPTVGVLLGEDLPGFRAAWNVPYGRVSIGIDPLSAFFLAPLFLLGGLAAVYGRHYLSAYRGTKLLAAPTALLNVCIASMALVVVARNGVLFLVAWEVMTLTSYLLVTFEHEEAEVRRAGWVYLLAAHAGVACLILLFLLLGRQAGSLEFEAFRTSIPASPRIAGALFALAAIGFGIKAGFVPVHVWLPEAHAAAPSHVSALMSGVLIKIGIYGFVRILTLLPAAAWWGPLLMTLGIAGALLGIGLALQQRDLKRVLAYSSIENVGIVLLGVGVGYWGMRRGDPRLATLGFYGGLLHLWNHALMKALMFFSAGSILHGAGTKDLERLGGLMRTMPRTATAMMVGAVAMSALPPLNGFLGEWLIYAGLIGGGIAPRGVAALFIVGALAFAGGLTALCFVRLAGVALLGTARGPQATAAHESSLGMVGPIWVLAASCIAIGIFPAPVLAMMSPVAAQLLGPALLTEELPRSALATLAVCNVGLWAVLGGLGTIVFAGVRGRAASDATWGCGYAAPTARMQYTARSFSELSAERLLPAVLRARVTETIPRGIFPVGGAYATEYVDPLTRGVYEPFFDRWGARFSRLRWVQQGFLHVYLVYILTVIVLGLAWTALRSWMLP